MEATDLAWLAGLLEGEGCFREHPTTAGRYPCIQLKMTDRDVVERAAALMGGNAIVPVQPKRPGSKEAYRTTVVGSRAVALMEELLPLMGRRRSAKVRDLLSRAEGSSSGRLSPSIL